jgi:hypothetical protein
MLFGALRELARCQYVCGATATGWSAARVDGSVWVKQDSEPIEGPNGSAGRQSEDGVAGDER